MSFTWILHVLFVLSITAHGAEKKARRVPVKAGQQIKIIYGSAPWNIDSTKVDSAFLYIKDSQSNKLVKIQLEETEPDSSIFMGRFSLGWDTNSSIEPEVFVPPLNMRDKNFSEKKFYDMLTAGQVPRKPIVFRKLVDANQVIDVYDTKEQAQAGLKIYQEELKALKNQDKRSAKKIAAESTVEAAELAAKKAALLKLAQETATRETERVRLEQLERQKSDERKKLMDKMNAEEKAKKRAQAETIADEAIAHYKAGEYAKAEDSFEKAVETDPSTNSYYYYYGVTLYRLEKFNDALVKIKMSEGDKTNDLERKYYLGLIHYRLKELEPAMKNFKDVSAGNDPDLSPSAKFYEGLLYMSQDKLEDAKSSFEMVLDTSKDPNMDKMAEEYIEKILALIQYKEMAKKTIFLTAMIATVYDSNILLAPDNDTTQGTSLGKGGLRYLLMGTGEYRWAYKPTYEFSTKLATAYYYSQSADFSHADPWLTSVTAPYTYKGMLFGKGYKFVLAPGYDVLYMEPAQGAGTRENIMNSVYVSAENTFVMRDDWFSVYTLEVRQDDSKLPGQTPTTDADSTKLTLKTSQMFFLDSAKKRAVIPSAGFVVNSAKGNTKTYDRMEVGAMYMAPVHKWKDATWLAGLSAYRLSYNVADRRDTNTTLTAAFNKAEKDWWSWGVIGTYSNNPSNVEVNHYSKYTLMLTASFNNAF